MKNTRLNDFWTIVATVMTGLATAGTLAQADDDLGGFEGGAGGWRYYGGFEFKGAKGAAQVAAGEGVEGGACLRIQGDFTGGGFYVGAQLPLRPFLPAQGARFMARSDSIERIMIRATDFTGQTHQFHVALKPDGAWQQIIVQPLNQGERYGHFGGDINDGAWHPPLRSLFIGFDKKGIRGGELVAQLDLDNIQTIAETRPADRRPASDPVAAITLKRQTQVDAGLSARGGDKGKVIASQRNGRECWMTDRKAECRHLYLNLDDTRGFGKVDRASLEVTYLDEGLEPIVVQVADSQGKAVEVGKLPRRNTQRWVTATVELRQVDLSNRLNDEDVRLAIEQVDMAVAEVKITLPRKESR
jgi:hypothetical protein